jgi:hypothetical protein
MTFILSIHPLGQLVAILIAFYAGFLGLRRMQSLHFRKNYRFHRVRHVIFGSSGLIFMLGGMVAGYIMVNRYLLLPDTRLHVAIAKIILLLGVFGLSTGFFLYLMPGKRRVLPLIHGINNLLILALALGQIVTGVLLYLRYVLYW